MHRWKAKRCKFKIKILQIRSKFCHTFFIYFLDNLQRNYQYSFSVATETKSRKKHQRQAQPPPITLLIHKAETHWQPTYRLEVRYKRTRGRYKDQHTSLALFFRNLKEKFVHFPLASLKLIFSFVFFYFSASTSKRFQDQLQIGRRDRHCYIY